MNTSILLLYTAETHNTMDLQNRPVKNHKYSQKSAAFCKIACACTFYPIESNTPVLVKYIWWDEKWDVDIFES